KAERVKDCAEILEYKQNSETGERKLYRVWICKSRLCPMCNWRRAMKHGIQSQKVVAEVTKQKTAVRWLYLTFTVKTVYGGEALNKTLSDMAQGFSRMMQYKKINKNLVCYMRATEVTINNKDNSYNQHMHVLVCVEPTYFKNTEKYVNQKQWIQYRKKTMKSDYAPKQKVK